MGDWDGAVYSRWSGIRTEAYAHGPSRHGVQSLVRACIEGTGCVVAENPVF